MAEITDAELSRLESNVDIWYSRKQMLRLITAYRESQAEVRRLRSEAEEREKMFYGRV